MKKILLFIIIVGKIVFAQELMLTQDTISSRENLNNNPFVSKDSKGRIHLVYTNQFLSSPSSKEIYYAIEEADSFKNIRITDNYLEETAPSLSIDKDENAHITFLCKDSTYEVYQIKYTNNINGNFEEPIYITQDEYNKTSPASVIGNDSILYIAYFGSTLVESKVFYITYNLKTGKVSAPVSLCSGESSGENDIAMVLDKKGRVHIVVKSGEAEGGELKYFVVSKGTIKELQVELENKIKQPKILIDRFNAAYILYKNTEDNKLYLVNNFVGYFKKPIAVTPEDQNPVRFGNFSIDERERFCFVYQSKDTSGKVDLFLVHGNGKQFSNPIRIQKLGTEELAQNSANVVTNGNGQIAVVFSKAEKKRNNTVSDLIIRKGFLFGYSAVKIKNDSLVFQLTKLSDTSDIAIEVINPGTAPLKVFSPVISRDEFSVDLQDTLLVKPDSSKFIHIFFHPADTLEHKAFLKLTTNTTNTKTIKINLWGKGLGIPRLFTSKDTLALVEEKNYSDSLLIINKGGDILKIDSVKSLSDYSFIFNYEKNQLNPGESVWIKLHLDKSLDSYNEHFIDSILVYSNDPLDGVKRIIVHSKYYSMDSEESKPVSELYQLHQNYPNPFNPQTTISFTISEQAHVLLRVFDALAREIATLVNGTLPAGRHTVTFNGDKLATGVYYYKLQIKSSDRSQPDYVEVKKMILVK